ncbi:MAG: peptidyl-prolyl cis-trans isomerase [Candidatus Schekmanbacteria bacterium]|nr:peptidyl-prolyl cis-trans isomerase [Candidatus Schekmanbacteria bacterium]
MIDSYSEELLIEMVQERRVKDLKADDAEVDNLYKKEVKELKIKSVLFEKEEDAKKMIEEIKNGKNFDEIAQTLISNETAKGDIDGTYLREKELQPNVFKAVSEMEIGGISSIVPVIKGFSIFKLEETRFPEDAGIKEKITNEVLNRKKVQVLIEYNSELLKKYVKINQKLVDKIDFEALKPGFEELLKDNRIVAEIEGGDKVTVGQWADAIKQKYFHGADRAIERKRVNKNKYEVLEKIIVKKALIIEASKAGIDKTEEYTNMIKGYGDSLVFNEFVKKAVAPNIKMNEEDKQKYYEDHKMEYAYSEMVKIDALGFENIDFAKSALKKLDSGAEFEWIKENAEGKLDNISDEILAIEGNVIATDSLPDDIKKALSGVKKGDFRLYEAADGFFYVFYIKEFYVAVPQPFEDVKDLITNKVVGEKLNSELRYWENKLREQSDIRIFFQSEASM